MDHVIGDPASDEQAWHLQEEPDSCAVAAQEFVIAQLTGQDPGEAALRDEAAEHGWYLPGDGTPPQDVGNLLEAHGLDVERDSGASVDDLGDALAGGEKVIVGVDADEIWEPGLDPADDSSASDQGHPGQDANHAVELIGLADTELGPVAVLDDSGVPDGAGEVVPLGEFVDAWDDSGDFEVEATS